MGWKESREMGGGRDKKGRARGGEGEVYIFRSGEKIHKNFGKEILLRKTRSFRVWSECRPCKKYEKEGEPRKKTTTVQSSLFTFLSFSNQAPSFH